MLGFSIVLLLMEEILHQLVGSWNPIYWQGFRHPQVVQDFFHQQYSFLGGHFMTPVHPSTPSPQVIPRPSHLPKSPWYNLHGVTSDVEVLGWWANLWCPHQPPLLTWRKKVGKIGSPLVVPNIAGWKTHPFLIGDTSTQMVHFPASYASLPECSFRRSDLLTGTWCP